MVFFKGLKMQKSQNFKTKKNKKKEHIFSIFKLKKVNMQTFELYKTIYFLKVHLELSFSHISWALINYDNINFINLKNRTILKILEVRQIQEASFNVQLEKRLWILFAIESLYINSRMKNNPLDNGLLSSQNDSTNTEVWKAPKITKIFTVRTRNVYLLDHNFEQFD